MEKGKPKTCLYLPNNLVTGVLLSEKISSVNEFILSTLIYYILSIQIISQKPELVIEDSN